MNNYTNHKHIPHSVIKMFHNNSCHLRTLTITFHHVFAITSMRQINHTYKSQKKKKTWHFFYKL